MPIVKLSSNLLSTILSLLALFIALLLCSVEVFDGGLIVLVLLIQTFSGMLIYQRVSLIRLSLSAEFLAMGFAIGSFLSMAGDQLLMGSKFSEIGWLLPLGLGLSSRINKQVLKTNPPNSRYQHTFLWALAGAFVSLGIEWFWTFPIGLSFAILLWILDFGQINATGNNPKLVRDGVIASLVFTTLAMLWTRPKIWWMQHWYDYYQFENWSSSLAQFGPNGVTSLNYELKYHWFSFAWNGLLGRLSNAQPWVATTRASVLISAIGIQLFFMAIIEVYGHKSTRTKVISVFLATFTTVAIWNRDSFHVMHLESFSLIFSLIWLFAVYLLLLRMRSSFKISGAALIVMMSVASIGGKSSFGLLAACAVIALAIEIFINVRKQCLPYFTLAAVNLVILIVSARLWLVDSDMPKIYLPSIGFMNFLGDMSSENLIFRKHQVLMLAIAWFSGVFLIHLISSLFFVRDMFTKIHKIYLLETLVLFAGFASVSFITFFAASQIYIAYGSFVLLVPFVGSVLLTQFDENDLVRFVIEQSRRVAVAFLVMIILILGSFYWPFRSIDVNTPTKVLVRQLPYLGTFLVAVFIYFFFRGFSRLIKQNSRGLVSGLIIVALTIASSTFYLTEWSSRIKPSYERMEREEALNTKLQFGLTDEYRVANWINRFTSKDSVFATNYMYSECSSCVRSFKPINSRLPIEVEIFEGLVHRRLLIRQPNFNNAGIDIVNSPRINDLRSKKLTISYFINTGDYSSLTELRKYGVNFLIVSLDDTSRRDWGDLVNVVFESAKFIVLDVSEVRL